MPPGAARKIDGWLGKCLEYGNPLLQAGRNSPGGALWIRYHTKRQNAGLSPEQKALLKQRVPSSLADPPVFDCHYRSVSPGCPSLTACPYSALLENCS